MPDWVLHVITLAGFLFLVAGFILGFVPFIKKYSIPIKILGGITFIFGMFLEGGLANEMIWQMRVKEVEAKVAKAEAESANLNTQLQAALGQKKEVIREKGDTIVKYVDRFKDREVLKEVQGPERVKIEKVIEYIEHCPVPKELLELHNKAATMNKGEKK